MIAADVLFRQTANMAAQASAGAPAYIAYQAHVDVDVSTYHRHKTIERAIEVRTADDTAVLQDLPKGRRRIGHAFPVAPSFDAISYFQLRYDGIRDAYAWVENVHPITFTNPATSTRADVVVTSLRYYYATYADDTTDAIAHIHMQPLPTLTRGNPSDFFINDVYVDTASMLPTRVVYVGPTTTFDVHYGTATGHWLIDRVHYAHSVVAPLHLAHVDFTVDCDYRNVTFPALPAAPELRAPAAAPSPAASP